VIVAQDLAEIYKPIRGDLELFKRLIREELDSPDVFIRSILDYLLGISGKHLRPALAILSARLGGNRTDVPVRLAIAIELLHTATLIHDDIIDGSMYRRNQLSMNAKWGVEVSIICGDYLYAKAFSILSALGDAEINRMFSLCARTMCEGEMKQVERRKSLDMGEEAYTEIIRKKTASLFQAACAVGGYVARRDVATLRRLSDYGLHFGLAFQIADDCLDIVGEEEEIGKKAGLDFEKRDPTLPLIYLYETLAPSERDELRRLGEASGAADRLAGFQRIKELCVERGVVERAMERAREHAARAAESLRAEADSPYRKSLLDLVDYALQRI
jgi:octaprenyl-diphosphate synthase